MDKASMCTHGLEHSAHVWFYTQTPRVPASFDGEDSSWGPNCLPLPEAKLDLMTRFIFILPALALRYRRGKA